MDDAVRAPEGHPQDGGAFGAGDPLPALAGPGPFGFGDPARDDQDPRRDRQPLLLSYNFV